MHRTYSALHHTRCFIASIHHAPSVTFCLPGHADAHVQLYSTRHVTSGMRIMGSAIGMKTTAVPFYYKTHVALLTQTYAVLLYIQRTEKSLSDAVITTMHPGVACSPIAVGALRTFCPVWHTCRACRWLRQSCHTACHLQHATSTASRHAHSNL